MDSIALRMLKTIGAAAMLAAPAGLLAAPLVVRSTGPSAKAYPAGRPIAENSALVLKAGDVVTVLAPSGARTLRGPGTFRVAGSGNAMAFNPRSRFGAMRGADVPPAPGLWDVDVSRGGKVCLADSKQVLLWRPTSSADATLEVVPAAGAGQRIAWAAGRTMQLWPQQLAIADGAEYSVKWADESDSRRLTFKFLGAVGEDPTVLAKSFIDNGCDEQLDRLIVEAPEDAGSVAG